MSRVPQVMQLRRSANRRLISDLHSRSIWSFVQRVGEVWATTHLMVGAAGAAATDAGHVCDGAAGVHDHREHRRGRAQRQLRIEVALRHSALAILHGGVQQ